LSRTPTKSAAAGPTGTSSDSSALSVERAATHLRSALEALGLRDDPELATTPERVAELWAEFRAGTPLPRPEAIPTRSRDPIVIRGLPFHSLCAHHFLPFFGTCDIAVRPAGSIVGLGWYPRVLGHFSRQPQLQERLADQVAGLISAELGAVGVIVRLEARQLCVEMRGAHSPGRYTVTARRGEVDPQLEGAVGG